MRPPSMPTPRPSPQKQIAVGAQPCNHICAQVKHRGRAALTIGQARCNRWTVYTFERFKHSARWPSRHRYCQPETAAAAAPHLDLFNGRIEESLRRSTTDRVIHADHFRSRDQRDARMRKSLQAVIADEQ